MFWVDGACDIKELLLQVPKSAATQCNAAGGKLAWLHKELNEERAHKSRCRLSLADFVGMSAFGLADEPGGFSRIYSLGSCACALAGAETRQSRVSLLIQGAPLTVFHSGQAGGRAARTGAVKSCSIICSGSSGRRVNVRLRKGLQSSFRMSAVFMCRPSLRKSLKVWIGRKRSRWVKSRM